MSRKTVYLNLNLDIPEQAAVYELLTRWGRRKNTLLCEALSSRIRDLVSEENRSDIEKRSEKKETKKDVKISKVDAKSPHNNIQKAETDVIIPTTATTSTESATVQPANISNTVVEERNSRKKMFTAEQLADIANADVDINVMSEDRFKEFADYIMSGIAAENAKILASFTA